MTELELQWEESVTVKVKLSLCLTNYKGMKTYPLHTEAPRHEDVLGECV
jgi:hypothetical protein